MKPDALLMLANAALLVLMYCGTQYFIAYLSGWRKLAARFRDRNLASGTKRYFVTGSVGFFGYGHCFTLCVSPIGLRLSATFPFLLFHPPLLIPWEELRHATKLQGVFITYATLEVGDPVITTIALPASYLEPYIILPSVGS